MIQIDKSSFELSANLETSSHTQEPLERRVFQEPSVPLAQPFVPLDFKPLETSNKVVQKILSHPVGKVIFAITGVFPIHLIYRVFRDPWGKL